MLREIEQHPEQQRPLAELREEFRSEHLSSLRDQMFTTHLGWGVIGDPLHARSRYTAEEWGIELLHRLDEDVHQDFDLDAASTEYGSKFIEIAGKVMLDAAVTWEDTVDGVVDHDASPCPPVETMTEDELCDYVDSAIKESAIG